MSKTNHCPKQDAILRWLLDTAGREPTTEETALASHVDQCTACQGIVEGLLAESTTNLNLDSSPQEESDDLATQVAAQIKEQLRDREQGDFVFSPGDCLDNYEILAWVGGGNSGHVYRARDNRLARTVALKVLRPDHSGSGLTRLMREAKAVAALSHEHIVALYDVRLDEGPTPYLVMEWVAGGTIRQLVRGGGPIESREAARIAAQVASALAAAHEQGLIHRDLKSANVLLNNTGDAKLADFGLVRDLESDSNLTREHIVAGTPAYMAPEQIQDARNVDGRADLYSFGVMLYEMLTGELPFRGIERMVLQQTLYQDPKRPRLLNDLVPRDLETICLKCLSKPAQERYGSAQELQADLDRFLAGEPIQARPVSLATVAWRWCLRNAAIAGSLAVALLAILALAVGATIAALQLRSTSLTAQQNAILATRGRDHLQDTLRELVFDVNELLDADSVDLDEAQERLLVVAIDGLRKAAELGEGAQDESSAASKNRLARVLFRLDRDAEAQAYFEQALKESEALIANGYPTQAIWIEKLYALQGLQSIAAYEEQTELVDLLQIRIDEEVPSAVIEAYADRQLGTTWLDELSWISESEPAVASQRLREALANWTPDLRSAEVRETLTSILYTAQEIDNALGAAEKREEALRMWDAILAVVQDGEQSSLDHEASADLGYARFVCFNGKSWIAYAQDQLPEFVELQKAAFAATPRDPNKRELFEWSVREAMHDASVVLLDATISANPSLLREYQDWFTEVAQQDLRNVEKLIEDENEETSTEDGYWMVDYLISRTHHAQLLSIVGEQAMAKEKAALIEQLLKPMDVSQLRKADRRLIKEIRQIIAGLSHEQDGNR